MSSTLAPPDVHPVLAALAALDGAVDALGDTALWTLGEAQLLDARVQLERVTARLDAQRVRLTGELDTRGAPVSCGAASTTGWLVNRLRQPPAAAARELRLADALRADRLPALAAALTSGAIGLPAAVLIADTDTDLAAFASSPERAEAEAALVEQAGCLTIPQLGALARRVRVLPDPDQGERLAADEHTQHTRRELRLLARPDGSADLRGYLDTEAHHLLRTALDALAHPPNPDQPNPPNSDAARDDTPAAGRPRVPLARRHGDALLELAALALRTDQLPSASGQPVRLTVAVHYPDLAAPPAPSSATARGTTGRLGFGVYDTGQPISIPAVRRLACDATLIPALLGAAGEPLDIGRATRTVPPAIRRALDLPRRRLRVVRSGGGGPYRPVPAIPPAATGPPCAPTPITSPTGPTAARPRWAIWCCSAPAITAPSTTTAGRSNWRGTIYPPSPHPPGSTPTSNPDATTATGH